MLRSLKVASLLVVLTTLVTTACSDDSTSLQSPFAIVPLSGDAQSALPGAALANPLVVEVLNKEGTAVEGTTITWTVSASNGTLSATTSTTDATGVASVNWTLGPTAGAETVTAATGSLSATFSATATDTTTVVTSRSGRH